MNQTSLLASVQPMTPTQRVESVLAIDPGTTRSAMCWLRDGMPIAFSTQSNDAVLRNLYDVEPVDGDVLSIEMIASYGMPVGREVFETCVWIGRFIEAWRGDFEFVYRSEVKTHLCRSVRAKDANVAQALRDRFGGKGTKKVPGVLYGIKGDEWAALAVAVTYWDKKAAEAVALVEEAMEDSNVHSR